jgi:hypothetical protein
MRFYNRFDLSKPLTEYISWPLGGIFLALGDQGVSSLPSENRVRILGGIAASDSREGKGEA